MGFLVVDELREMLRSLLSDQMDKEAIEFDRLGIALRLVRFDLYHLLLRTLFHLKAVVCWVSQRSAGATSASPAAGTAAAPAPVAPGLSASDGLDKPHPLLTSSAAANTAVPPSNPVFQSWLQSFAYAVTAEDPPVESAELRFKRDQPQVFGFLALQARGVTLSLKPSRRCC